MRVRFKGEWRCSASLRGDPGATSALVARRAAHLPTPPIDARGECRNQVTGSMLSAFSCTGAERPTIIEPMFPRYLFIHLSTQDENWGPIRSTIGVTQLVRFGNVPAQVPEDLVSILQAREDADGIQELPQPDFQRGDTVRIVDGA